jgi:hypothetical protein
MVDQSASDPGEYSREAQGLFKKGTDWRGRTVPQIVRVLGSTVSTVRRNSRAVTTLASQGLSNYVALPPSRLLSTKLARSATLLDAVPNASKADIVTNVHSARIF